MLTGEVKVPLPIPDDSNEWSAPLWDEDSLRAYGDARERAARAAAFDDALREIPTTWLDPLLSGLDAIARPPYSGADIEALMRALRERLRARAEEQR